MVQNFNFRLSTNNI